jgi:serine/threonine-protein kinase
MKQIKHPSILPISEYQLVNEDILVIRPMIHGETLASMLKIKGVHEAQAISLFRQIIAGLSELHRLRIHVGHYTPKSLMIKEDGGLVFAETGLLNRLHAINKMTGEFIYEDAPMYATPERIQGRTVDTRSDIYIAGLIGYEMIAGVPVYHKGSVRDILYAHAVEPVPDLPNKNHPLNLVFRDMLQKTPSKRIQTAKEVLLRLDMLVDGDNL